MALIISKKILLKLQQKHGVGKDDVIQCFANRGHSFLEDTREDHKTDPVTKWFIAETDFGRKLKVAFVMDDKGDIYLKTAYPANCIEKHIYKNHAKTLDD